MKWQEIPTPCYVVDEKKLKQNLKILQNLEQETGCHVLLAQKAFSADRAVYQRNDGERNL